VTARGLETINKKINGRRKYKIMNIVLRKKIKTINGNLFFLLAFLWRRRFIKRKEIIKTKENIITT
jgi:hypothetical protein